MSMDDGVGPPKRLSKKGQDFIVYVIDDDSDVRRSLHYLLDVIGITVWPFASAADFLSQLPFLAPAPILLDIRMPEMDGFGLLAKLGARDIRWPVIVMSAHGDIPSVVRAMKLGATDFLEKPFEVGEIELVLKEALGKISEVGREFIKKDKAKALFDKLTPREYQVVFALMRGLSNKSMACQFSLSARTIEMHRANALAKLKVKSVAGIIAIASSAKLKDLQGLAA